MATVDTTIEAVSSTAPPAVTHEWSGWGDRKNTSAGKDVWLSSMSTKNSSHRTHTSLSLSIRPRTQNRSIISAADGGEPARTSSAVTAASRRENAE